MKNTALYQKHIDANAKMVPFAGFNMPVQYEGVNIEHETVRNGVGVFDVSHMGEFFLRGPKALDLIQRVTTNDASVLFDGKAQYSCMPNGKGGIVDDLIIYRIHQEEYLLVVGELLQDALISLFRPQVIQDLVVLKFTYPTTLQPKFGMQFLKQEVRTASNLLA